MGTSMGLPDINSLGSAMQSAVSSKVQAAASSVTTPSEYIAQLRANNMGQEAVQSLTRMMSKENAVEWAEQSARMAGEKTGLSDVELDALDAAKDWSANPTEEARAAAAAAAEKLPADSPAMWAANAAAYSKSMEPAFDASAFPAVNDLTGQMAAGSVQLAAAKMALPEMPQSPSAPDMPTMPEMQNALEVPKTQMESEAQEIAVAKLEELTAEQRAQVTKQLDPFLDMGVKIAESSPGWS